MASKAKKHEIDLGIGSAIAEIGDCDDSIPGIDLLEAEPNAALVPAVAIATEQGDTLSRIPSFMEHAGVTIIRAQQPVNSEVDETPNQAIALAKDLGYEGAIAVGALEDEIRFYQRRTVEGVLELGKRLLILKALTPHGEFGQRVDMLGIDQRLAQRFMTATIKFSKAASKPLLKAAGTQTKLLELLVLDDEELEVLGSGETVGVLNLDEIEVMSVSELKAALRTHKREGSVEVKKAEERANRLQYQLDEKEDLIETLRNAQNLNPEFRLETNIIREQSALLDQQCAVALAALGGMADALDNEDGSEPEWDIRFQSVWFAAHAAYARALLLVQSLLDMDVDDLVIPADPGEFKEGLFTAQEAKAFIDEVDSNRVMLAERLKLKRDKLEEEAPRGPGRPKKVKAQK